MLDFSNSNFCDDHNKLVVGKMKYETAVVAFKEFIGWKPKIYLLLIDYNSG